MSSHLTRLGQSAVETSCIPRLRYLSTTMRPQPNPASVWRGISPVPASPLSRQAISSRVPATAQAASSPFALSRPHWRHRPSISTSSSRSQFSTYSPLRLSPTLPTMAAQKIDGTAIAKSIRERINSDIKDKQKSNPRYKPSLVIIQGIPS